MTRELFNKAYELDEEIRVLGCVIDDCKEYIKQASFHYHFNSYQKTYRLSSELANDFLDAIIKRRDKLQKQFDEL